MTHTAPVRALPWKAQHLPEPKAKPFDRRLLRLLTGSFRPWAGPILLVAALGALSAVLEVGALTSLVLFAKLTAEGKSVYTGNLGWLHQTVEIGVVRLLTVGALVVVARLVLQVWNSWLEASIGAQYRAEMRERLFQTYLAASWERKNEGHISDLQNLLMVNIETTVALLNSLSSGVAALGNILVLLLAAIVVSPLFALVLSVAGACIFFALRPLTRWARQSTHADADLNMRYAREATEAMRLAQEIEVFGVAPAVAERTSATVEKTRKSTRSAYLTAKLLAPLYQNLVLLLAFGALAAVTFTGIVQVEVLGITVLLLLRTAAYTQGLQSVYHHVVGKAPFLEQLNEAEARFRSQLPFDGNESIAQIERLSFQDVSFAYSPELGVLKNISLEIRAGEMIGIVGPSGAGKSTLTRVLLGLHAPSSGAILVNEVPLQSLKRAVWQRRIAYVAQEPRLIEGTIADNVRFFRSMISREQVEAAVKLASLHEAVAGAIGGYDARLGEGVDLSGGERQRLCIARALVGRPELLILDEPTSALDAVSEAAIQRTLRELHGKVTTLIVAHRLSTLEFCDRLLVMRGGRVEAFDTPDRVASTNAFFRESQQLMLKTAT